MPNLEQIVRLMDEELSLVALHRWMKDNNYQLVDVPRLVHLLHAEHMDPSQYVTEIQFPVRKQEQAGGVVA